MIKRQVFAVATLLSVLVWFAAPAAAQTPADPILKMDSKSEIELDLGLMVDDLMPLLMDVLEVEGEEEAAQVRRILDLLGVQALDRLHMWSEQSKDRSTSRLEITLDESVDGGLLARKFAMEEGECHFARYLDRESIVMVSVIHDLAGHLEMLLDYMALPEVAEMIGEMPVDEEGELTFGDFTPRTDLLPLMAGELDIVMLDAPAGAAASPMLPISVPLVLAIGANDGRMLRDRLVEIADSFSGEEEGGIGAMLEAIPVEEVGDFDLQVSPFGVALAASDEFLVIGMSGEELRTVLTNDGDLKVPDGMSYMYMDGAKYGTFMGEVMTMTEAMSSEEVQENLWMSRFYTVLFEHMHSQTELVTSEPGKLVIENEVDGPLMTGLYRMVHVALEELPAIMRAEKEKEARREATAPLREAVGELDAAFIAYAEDHDGLYPADPTELVTAGYLEEFPLAMPVPAGQYVEGAYTYHALHDDAGQVAGYFLFVYGGGEGTGYDVYTPENLADLEHFHVGSDGVPDGVATFCYDGLAFEQMEAWRGE
jgi:hypothetical protein